MNPPLWNFSENLSVLVCPSVPKLVSNKWVQSSGKKPSFSDLSRAWVHKCHWGICCGGLAKIIWQCIANICIKHGSKLWRQNVYYSVKKYLQTMLAHRADWGLASRWCLWGLGLWLLKQAHNSIIVSRRGWKSTYPVQFVETKFCVHSRY